MTNEAIRVMSEMVQAVTKLANHVGEIEKRLAALEKNVK